MTTQSGLSTDRWYFSKDQIASSPSFKRGIINAKETSYRQHAALLIQEMGQKLKVYVDILRGLDLSFVCFAYSFPTLTNILCLSLNSLFLRNQLCINTAIVYMHRFFMCHPFDKFARNVSVLLYECKFYHVYLKHQFLNDESQYVSQKIEMLIHPQCIFCVSRYSKSQALLNS